MSQSSRRSGGSWMDRVFAVPRWWNAVLEFAKRYAILLGSLALILPLVWFFGRDGLRWWKTRQRVIKAQRGQAHPSDATMLYQRMLNVLRRRGVVKPPWLTPFEFAHVLQEPELAVLVEDLTTAYNELRFGGRAEAAGRMVQLLERLEATP